MSVRANDLLLWRFPDAAAPDPLASAVRRVEGAVGERLAAAGVLAAVVDAKGHSSPRTVCSPSGRSTRTADQRKARFADLVEIGDDEQMRLLAEGESALAVRAVHVPADPAR